MKPAAVVEPLSDGCTRAPDFGFRPCCERHDRAYREHTMSRDAADAHLWRCIRSHGWRRGRGWRRLARGLMHELLAVTYWCGVRAFGARYYRAGRPILERDR